MVILFLTDSIPPRSIGGAARSVWRVAEQLHALGNEIHIVTTVQDRQFVGSEQRDGITIYNLYSRYDERFRAYVSLYHRSVLRHLAPIFARVRPDVIHADVIHYHISYAALKIAKRCAPCVFLTARDFMMIAYGKLELKTRDCAAQDFRVGFWENFLRARKRFNPLRNPIIRYYLRFVDVIFSNSALLANILAQNRIPGVLPMHNGLLLQDSAVSDEGLLAFRRECELEGRDVVLFPARVSPAKGLQIVLEAMEEVAARMPDAVLLVVGVREEDRTLLQERTRSVLAGRVRLFGWTSGETLRAAFASADVVLVPSLYPDPFPTVALEAALYKKPVIATCFGGAKEFVLDGQTGYIVNPFEKADVAEKIVELLGNKERARQFGEAGYQRLKNSFTVAHQAERQLRYYRQCLAAKTTRGRKRKDAKD